QMPDIGGWAFDHALGRRAEETRGRRTKGRRVEPAAGGALGRRQIGIVQVIRADRHLRRSTARGKRGAGRIRPCPLRSEELTGVVAEYSTQLPAARDRLQQAPAAGQERTSLTERK